MLQKRTARPGRRENARAERARPPRSFGRMTHQKIRLVTVNPQSWIFLGGLHVLSLQDFDLDIPEKLVGLLVDDWEYITKQQMVFPGLLFLTFPSWCSFFSFFL